MMKKKENEINFFTKGSPDFILIIVVAILLALGLIMVLSASSATALSESGDSYAYFKRQITAAIVGVVAAFICSKIDYRIYRKFKWIMYVVVVALLFLVGISSMGRTAGGATRWIRIGGFNFQPSEVAKLVFILFYASLLTDLKQKDKIKSFWWGCLFPLMFLIPVVISVLILQNHFSATLIICGVSVIQMLIAGTKLVHFVILGFIGMAGLGVFVGIKSSGKTSSNSFRITRIQTWLDPWSDMTGSGWQIIQSLYAIGSGGLFGLGLNQSKQKYLYLPEPQNDFIFAVLAEELGYVGCLAVIILFLVFIWRGILIAMRARDTFGSLIAIGIVSLIGIQAIINIAVVTNTIPVTGMELPFFSYGGTAILVNLTAVGILVNISKSASKK